MKRNANLTIKIAFLLISLGIFPVIYAQTITIDLNTNIGPAKHVASGFLHGFSSNGSSPSATLTKPLKLTCARYQAYTALTTRMLDEGVPIGMQQIQLSDSWGYDKDPSLNNYADWETFIVNQVNKWKNQNLHPQYDIWNEPDFAQFWKWEWSKYLETFRRAYVKIKQTDPLATVCGGSFAFFKPLGKDAGQFTAYLQYCKTNNVVPEYIAWHFPADYVAEVAECRRLISTMGLTSVRGITINEIIVGTEYTGTLLYHICQAERAGVDAAMHACWDNHCFDGSLDGVLTGGQPTGKYYVYERYARVAGRVVQTTPSGTLELYAAKDSTTSTASAVFGSPDWFNTINIKIKGFSKTPYLVNNGKVHVFLEKIKATDPQQACPTSMIAKDLDQDYTITGDSLVIPYNFGGMYYACYLKLTRPGGAVAIVPVNIDKRGLMAGNFSLTYRMVDIRGRTMRQAPVAQSASTRRSIGSGAAGVYVLIPSSERSNQETKMVFSGR